MGVCEGATFPSVSAMMAQWAPQSERSRMGTFIYAGKTFFSSEGSYLKACFCFYTCKY